MTVAALYRYPVKSMLGESLTRATLTDRGVLGDRAYAVLDVATGIIASAKVPKRWLGLLSFSARFVAEPVAGEHAPPVEITFPDGSVLRSDDEGLDIALSAALGREVSLISVPPEGAYFEELWPDIEGLTPQQLAPRTLIDATTTRHEDTGETISRFDVSAFGAPGTFFDLSSLHVMTESTLDRLRELAPDATFDPLRYRPNIVLRGDDAGFVENDWPGATSTLGDAARITFSFATMRCVMTTLAQGDLPDDPDTLRAIARHNRIEIPQVGGVWACAGVYAEVAAGGEIAVGDAHTTPEPAPAPA
ncbi:MOSC domain-containing protein [Pseudonocardia spirodelae]|uniref:MOSC N-terminal beta barrel domain-containing protein n=1 Tax=Pseudonocardia spirodelae TaxID=3133431 RepID=A0ABU8T788_9PSEU